MQAEMKPQKACRTVNRTEQLLVKRVGQLQTLHQVFGDNSPTKQRIRDQLNKQLRTNCRCDLVPRVRSNLNDPFVIKMAFKETKVVLEKYQGRPSSPAAGRLAQVA